ncbi:YegP family protein [Bordetella hinzii]|nr:YegP family protein [Bordetella hinzii]AKQ56075.1 hypothetical protein ACR54_02761 [Bordetella hinzii]AKQ60607.1 hypothetical protein ACR55_02740 [Bordetella hinzii]KCB25680.1 PF07411 domain protein [Bordetella hinzii L60]KCB25813.1 PF07411 domain protein [Bordetella hinzii OH87 BAL007II]KCB39183.1 PF07411 domain protein [Bordetella hinzii CA90 BAL1384]
MASWFELRRDGSGRYHFVLKDRHGETILTSNAYPSAAAAQAGIAAVQAHCTDGTCYLKEATGDGRCYFTLLQSDGKPIASSEVYGNEAARALAIQSLKDSGTTQDIRPAPAPAAARQTAVAMPAAAV